MHSSLHQLLECFIIWACLAFDFHIYLILDASNFVASSILLLSDKSDMSMFLLSNEMSLMKLFSSLLFLAIENLNELTLSFLMAIITERGV